MSIEQGSKETFEKIKKYIDEKMGDSRFFFYTWGEYYDYVVIYASGDTTETLTCHFEGGDPEIIEGNYTEGNNYTMYYCTFSGDIDINRTRIILRDKEDQEIYKVILNQADLNQTMTYAAGYVKGSVDEETKMTTPNQIADLIARVEALEAANESSKK